MAHDHPPHPSLQDPTKQYPRPPFQRQPQPAPGLAREMAPRPDHGEESYVGTGRLAGRKALITGADSGIGRAVAIAFAREGAAVTLNYLPQEQEDADEVIELARAAGVDVHAVPGDLTDEAFCQHLVDEAQRRMGGLDLVVNVAGKQAWQESIRDITTEQFDATFKTNVYAMFWICKAALEHLPPGASIINTASIQSYDRLGDPGRLRAHQGSHRRLHQGAGQASGQGRHPRQRRRARADLDPAAALRRTTAGEGGEVRRQRAAGSPGAAGGSRAGLRAAGFAGGELRDGRGLRRHRRSLLVVRRYAVAAGRAPTISSHRQVPISPSAAGVVT